MCYLPPTVKTQTKNTNTTNTTQKTTISKCVLIHFVYESEVLLKFPDALYSYCFHFDNFLIQDLFKLVCHFRLNRGCLCGSGKRSLPHTYRHLEVKTCQQQLLKPGSLNSHFLTKSVRYKPFFHDGLRRQFMLLSSTEYFRKFFPN